MELIVTVVLVVALVAAGAYVLILGDKAKDFEAKYIEERTAKRKAEEDAAFAVRRAGNQQKTLEQYKAEIIRLRSCRLVLDFQKVMCPYVISDIELEMMPTMQVDRIVERAKNELRNSVRLYLDAHALGQVTDIIVNTDPTTFDRGVRFEAMVLTIPRFPTGVNSIELMGRLVTADGEQYEPIELPEMFPSWAPRSGL